jgi:hypothetical protein
MKRSSGNNGNGSGNGRMAQGTARGWRGEAWGRLRGASG